MDIWGSFVALMTGMLVSLYEVVGSFGLAIIVFTIIVRLIFLPLSIKSTKSMRDMQANQAKLKPQLDALKKKYGNDRQRLLEEQNRLYKESGISPLSGLGGCLPMLIQMPIWIGLYSALFNLSSQNEAFLAPFLWLPNLADREGMPYILTAFTGISQFAIAKMTAQPSADDQQKTMNTMMQFMMPAMMVWFATQVPAGLVLYWSANNVFQFFQQLFTTGWGQLWPSRSKPSTTQVVVPAVSDRTPSRREEKERARAERSEIESPRNGRSGDSGVRVGALQLPETNVQERDGLRIYTLDPDGGEADLTAEPTSRTMEESIVRAKGQVKVRRKKKRP